MTKTQITQLRRKFNKVFDHPFQDRKKLDLLFERFVEDVKEIYPPCAGCNACQARKN